MKLAHMQVNELWNTYPPSLTHVQNLFVKDLRFRKLQPEGIARTLSVLRQQDDTQSIEKRRNALQATEPIVDIIGIWAQMQKMVPQNDTYRSDLISSLLELACRTEYAPYVARGLIYHRFSYPNDEAAAARSVVSTKLKSDGCKGANGLSEEDWTALDSR